MRLTNEWGKTINSSVFKTKCLPYLQLHLAWIILNIKVKPIDMSAGLHYIAFNGFNAQKCINLYWISSLASRKEKQIGKTKKYKKMYIGKKWENWETIDIVAYLKYIEFVIFLQIRDCDQMKCRTINVVQFIHDFNTNILLEGFFFVCNAAILRPMQRKLNNRKCTCTCLLAFYFF